ncbi:MAG: ABC transporter permease [Lachnospiraceae bacterium]|nr:ABC transporter permease [Lachnospiraceae bacterium]
MGIVTVLWEKWVEFRRDFYKITVAAMIAPLLYLLVFGMGIQTMSHGQPYLLYLIPGVVALTTMNSSFGAIAQNMNVQRLYERAFDQVMISPTSLWQFVMGQVLAGAIRGLYAGCIILILVIPLHTGLVFNGISFALLFLNGMVFSALGVVVSFLARNHADVPRFSTYFIMPMSFLCNTFFSTDNLPHGIREFLGALPLSQTSFAIRSIAWQEAWSPLVFLWLAVYLAVFLIIAMWFIYRKQNL